MRFLEAEGLSKTYIRRCKPKDGGISRLWKRDTQVINALQDASFSVDEGELVGLIGPNGAGKSTTVKLLTGILTPTGGTCRVDGRVPWLERREHVRHLGAVFGQRTQLWWDVPIHDSFLLLRDVYSLDKAAWQRRLDELVDALDLEEFLHTPLRQLSLGQRMRAELCGSLLHQPRLLFLDEPTIGLDAVSKLKLRAFLKEENRQRGTTILLTTHDMEDMLALCQRVMVLGRGKLLYDGQLDALLRRYDTVHTLRCTFDGQADLSRLPAAIHQEQDGEAHALTFAPAELPTGEVLSHVLACGTIREMTLKEQNIDHLIARMYEEMQL
ncbi:MAG: ATP-binding cassette domain-containing protein [Clostridia bacterium]|nr:ATP-binding cassette domain-containing protein [Clostridia bacterium]